MSDRLLKESDVLKLSYALPIVLNSTFYKMVKSLPTFETDMVKVVKCKDCRWYEDPDKKIFENCVRAGRIIPMQPIDYCSYGKRRE